MPQHQPDHAPCGVVLIVDDVPDNLSLLHDALDECGYMVLVATNGESALQRARQGTPDVILLDAMMPGMDGFEVCRQLKADYATQHIPVVFMTGLSETEHVVAAFNAGGTDYVTKPIRPPEVLARIAAHMQHARATTQARTALDAFGHAAAAANLERGVLIWQTPLARRLLQEFFNAPEGRMPAPLLDWLHKSVATSVTGGTAAPFHLSQSAQRLTVNLASQCGDDEWLMVLIKESSAVQIERLMTIFKLTLREAEVLYWVAKGKTSRDIGDILGSSPRTVNKHLEHIFEKLGAETRTAAAAMAMAKLHGVRT